MQIVNDINQMALRRLKDCIAEMHETPNANTNCEETKQYIKWDEVKDFLLMAEEALIAKDKAAAR